VASVISPYKENGSGSCLKTMDKATIGNIISRAKYQMRMLNDGYSRGDSHRKHIRERFTRLSRLDRENGDTVNCDKCNDEIKMGNPIFIHRRRSYNRYFHQECAIVLNLL
jgi:hypothetical protein